MTTLDFPTAAAAGQIFNASNGLRYKWTGTLWRAVASAAGIDLAALGIVGDGTSQTAKLQAILNENGGRVYALTRNGGDVILDGTVYMPTGAILRVEDDVTVRVGTLDWTGSVSAEQPLTQAAFRSDNRLYFATASLGLAVGDYIEVRGCINMLTPDAGPDQLGYTSTIHIYANEFHRITALDPTYVEFWGALRWDFTLTGGPNSGTRTISTVRKVSFTTGGLEGGIWRPYNTSKPTTVHATYARNLFVAGGRFVHDIDQATRGVELESCMSCWAENNVISRPTFPGGSGISVRSFLVIFGGESCTGRFNTIVGGSQCCDVSYREGGAIHYGHSWSHNDVSSCIDGGTSHEGGTHATFDYNVFRDVSNGIRIRTPHSSVNYNKGSGRVTDIGEEAGCGILMSGALDGSSAIGNIIDGFLFGAEVDFRAGASGDNPMPSSTVTVMDNMFANCNIGVRTITSDVVNSSMRRAVIIRDNIVDKPETCHVLVENFSNGTLITGNTFIGDGTNSGAIMLPANVADLTIGPNVFVDIGHMFALWGPGSTIITDLVAFPGGEAEARWLIAPQLRDGVWAGERSNLPSNMTPFVASTHTGRQDFRSLVNQTESPFSVNNNSFEITGAGMLAGASSDAFVDLFPAIIDIPTLKAALGVLFAKAPFSPLLIPTSAIYSEWDFERTAGIATSGSAITAITDRITGQPWAQGTGTAQPQLNATGFNGRQCGVFGGDDYLFNTASLATLGWPNAGAFEFWALIEYTGPIGASGELAYIVETPTHSFNDAFGIYAASGGVIRKARARVGIGGGSVTVENTNIDLMTGRHIIRVVSSGTTLRIDVDGMLGVPVPCVPLFTGGPRHAIGAMASAIPAAEFFTGKYNFMAYYRPLTDGIASALFQSLSVRRG
jgi:hypothetical protein